MSSNAFVMASVLTWVLSTVGLTAAFAADLPTTYPATYAATVAAAEAEGTVVVYAATDASAVAPLLKDFAALFPKIRVQYNDMGSSELYNRFLSEAAAGTKSGDVLFSPSLDLQVKLVMDGYAMTYRSAEADKLPAWADFRDQAYGVTYEPIVFAYNKRLLHEDQVPHSHAALAALDAIGLAALKGKVITQDPERVGSALLFASRDLQNDGNFFRLADALGRAGVKLYTSSGTVLERLTSGEASFAYNVMANYPISRAKRDPSVGVVFPEDYILVNSRVAFIWKDTPHPNASKVFLDYLLSVRGQSIIAQSLFSMRPDVDGELSAKALAAKYGDKLRAPEIDEASTAYLQPDKRLQFFAEWHKAVASR